MLVILANDGQCQGDFVVRDPHLRFNIAFEIVPARNFTESLTRSRLQQIGVALIFMILLAVLSDMSSPMLCASILSSSGSPAVASIFGSGSWLASRQNALSMADSVAEP